MSRYSLKPLPHLADVYEVAVGWDVGLDTYFVTVFGTPAGDGDPDVLLWRGSSFCEIRDLGALLGIVHEFAEVSPELVNRLESEKRASPQGLANPIGNVLSVFLRFQAGGR